MGKYCDTKVLERRWYEWLVSDSTPQLDTFRNAGLLWTKVLGKVRDKDGNLIKKGGQYLQDPNSHDKIHCLALANPVFIRSSEHGVPWHGTCFIKGRRCLVPLELVRNELNLSSSCLLHQDPLAQQTQIVPMLQKGGYLKETKTVDNWHAILHDVNSMCMGIAMKFNPPSEEEHLELSNDALLQVTSKLANKKLVYTPGRAPVFNLLTTTIFRCMYSIKNKDKSHRLGLNKLMDNMRLGYNPALASRPLRYAQAAMHTTFGH